MRQMTRAATNVTTTQLTIRTGKGRGSVGSSVMGAILRSCKPPSDGWRDKVDLELTRQHASVGQLTAFGGVRRVLGAANATATSTDSTPR